MSETPAAYTAQRVIKFRAWDGKRFYWFDDDHRYVLEFNKISGWNVVPNVPDYKGNYLAGDSADVPVILEQFTGLKDSNGIEIYEADVIEKEIEGPNGEKALFRGAVRYWGSGFCLAIPGYGSELLYSNSRRNGCVIGSIHEHADLFPA